MYSAFIEAYMNGLDGTQAAAWAIKKYRGHRTVSESIMKEFDISPLAA